MRTNTDQFQILKYNLSCLTRTNRDRRRPKGSRTFLLIFPSRIPGKIFRKNSDSPPQDFGEK